jgi:hypothetical protein
MRTPKKAEAVAADAADPKNYVTDSAGRVSLASLLTKNPSFTAFGLWIVGDTPLITHAWSEKAKREMLSKQVKSAKGGRASRDPEEDFHNSLYELPDGTYGFPATGFKNAVLSAAHKDKGVARSAMQTALWIDHDIVSIRPAHAAAICDMPMLRIYGTVPVMREDMVRVGTIQKTSTLAYRGQFSNWGLRVSGRINTDTVSLEQLVYMIRDAGLAIGLGEWRNERKGVFGSFHIADTDEAELWEAYAAGEGPLPVKDERPAIDLATVAATQKGRESANSQRRN